MISSKRLHWRKTATGQALYLDAEIDYLLELYDNADERAETVIETWVQQYSAANPVVPTHRLTEIDAFSKGYCYPLALKRLRKLISEP